MNEQWVLGIDTGSIDTGYCLIDKGTYKPLQFGKVKNEEVLNLINGLPRDTEIAMERFQSYGNAIGEYTIQAITWNGRFIQRAADRGFETHYVFRREVKINLCGTMKAKDANVRAALVERFAQHDYRNGKGTKANPDWFFGMAKDMWSAYAIATTYIDASKEQEGL